MQQSEWILAHSKDEYIRSVAGTFISSDFVTAKKFEEGEKYFSSMSANNPSDAVPHQALGELAEAQDHHDAAIAEYQKVLTIHPKDYMAFGGLGRSYTKLKRYDDAIAAYRKAIELSQSDEEDDEDLGFQEELRAVEKLKQDSSQHK